MPAPRVLLDLYLNLAQASEEQRRPLQRDKFLVLAAGIAQQAGFANIAEDCRRRILRHNPTHILKAFASMQEALRSEDVRQYTRQLLRVYPFEKAEYLLHKYRASGLTCRHAFGELLLGETGVGEPRRHPEIGGMRPAVPAPAAGQAGNRLVLENKPNGAGKGNSIAPMAEPQAPLPLELPFATPQGAVSYWSLAAWIVFAFALGVLVGGLAASYLFPFE